MHEHLLRFAHHRFQEYFAALYIHKVQLAIPWLDKLDAPRWQETLLNVILLDDTNRAAQILVDALLKPISDYQAKVKE